ncbi:hypothetical protein CVT24_002439, partial [Panaeolus cyanescens]
FEECVQVLTGKAFPSLVSATLGPVDLSFYTPINPSPGSPSPPPRECPTLTSLTLTFDTILDAQFALHDLFADHGRLRGQPLDSLTIICNNGTYATAFQTGRETKRAVTSNLALQFGNGRRQLTSLELVNVPFKDGVQLLRRWKSTKLRNLTWKNRVADFHWATPSQLGIDGNDPDWLVPLPVVQDLKSLSLSFPPHIDQRPFHSHTSALLSHIRMMSGEPRNVPEHIPDDTLSLELSHLPNELSSLSALPLVTLTMRYTPTSCCVD